MFNRPIPESYWVEPDRLLAGEYPGHFDGEVARKRIDALLEAGFDTFIDLTRPNETSPYFRILLEQSKAYSVDVRHHQFPIGDFGLPTPERMISILNTLTRIQMGAKSVALLRRIGAPVPLWAVTRPPWHDRRALQQLAGMVEDRSEKPDPPPITGNK
jgi:hypothetical protein